MKVKEATKRFTPATNKYADWTIDKLVEHCYSRDSIYESGAVFDSHDLLLVFESGFDAGQKEKKGDYTTEDINKLFFKCCNWIRHHSFKMKRRAFKVFEKSFKV